MEELKPCPFCGGEAKIRYTTGCQYWSSNIYYASEPAFVECLKCFARTKKFGKANNAVKAWNRRKDED